MCGKEIQIIVFKDAVLKTSTNRFWQVLALLIVDSAHIGAFTRE